MFVVGKGGVWEADRETGAVRHLVPLEGRTNETLTELALDARGQVGVAGDGNGGLVVWRLDTGDVSRVPGHDDFVHGVAITADGARAVTHGEDGKVFVWDVATRTRLLTIDHRAQVMSAALAPDGSTLYTACADRRIRRWDLKTLPDGALATRAAWRTPEALWLSSFVPLKDGRLLASAGEGTFFFDLTGGAVVRAFKGHRGTVNQVRVAPDGLRALTVAHDRSTRLWSVAPPHRELGAVEGLKNNVLCCEFSADGRTAVVGTDDPIVLLWDLRTLAEPTRLASPQLHWATSVALSPDGSTVFAHDHEGRLHAWRAKDGERLFTMRAHQDGSGRLALRRLDRVVTAGSVTRGGGPELALWDASGPGEPKLLRRFAVQGGNGTMSRLQVTPDGRRALVGLGAVLLLVDLEAEKTIGLLDLTDTGDAVYGLDLLDERTALVGTSLGLILRVALE